VPLRVVALGKRDNAAAVRARPRPEGLAANPAGGVVLSRQVGTCLQKHVLPAELAAS